MKSLSLTGLFIPVFLLIILGCQDPDSAEHTSSTAGELVAQLPADLHGLWCNGSSSVCDLGFGIDAKEIWDSSIGGCMELDSIRQQGDHIQASCTRGSAIDLVRKGPNRLELKIEGDQTSYTLTRQTGDTGASMDPDL